MISWYLLADGKLYW